MKNIIFILVISVLTFSTFFAQEVKKKYKDYTQSGSIKTPNETQAIEGDVIFTDGTNQLLRITDEGDFGAVELSNGIPTVKINKLYNNNGTLYFGDSALGSTTGGILELNDLMDAKSDGKSLYIGTESGIIDNGNNFNTGIGISSLRTNISGSHNVAIGNNALLLNVSGQNNVSTGSQSLLNNQIGSNNIAVGYKAMYSNLDGNENTSVGAEALMSNLQGFKNTAFGFQSLYKNLFGNGNIGIGAYSNYFNKDGNNNTIIGFEAGKGTADHNKSGNIFIGYQAGFNETTDNKLYIENSSSSNPLIYGDFNSDSIQLNGNLNVTGNNDLDGNLEVSGNLDVIGDITFSNNKIIPQNINDLTDSKTNSTSLFLGENAGNLESLSNSNIGIGKNSSLNNVSGKYNITIGNASNLGNRTGSRNTIIGYQAGHGENLNSKSGNVFIGYKAGYYETRNNKLYINNDSSDTPLIGGDFSTDQVRINGDLEVTNKAVIPKLMLTDGAAEGYTLTSDANGNATWQNNNPPKIGFLAHLESDFNENLLSSIASQLTNFTVNLDTRNLFNESTGEFTAPAAGFYHFDIKITWLNVSSDFKAEVKIKKNGATFTGSSFKTPIIEANYDNSISFSINVLLLANDKITLWVDAFLAIAAPGSNAIIAGGEDELSSSFSGYKIF